MKPKTYLPTAVIPFVLFVVACLVSFPLPADAQWVPSWLSTGRFWDWSDYRFKFEYRVFTPRLVSGYLRRVDLNTNQRHDYDLLAGATGINGTNGGYGGYGFNATPRPFMSALFQLYVDRLAFRLLVDEDVIFRGTLGNTVFVPQTFTVPPISTQSPSGGDFFRVSELDISATRLGMTLDLIRNPYLRAGVDFDISLNPVTFRDMKDAVTFQTVNPPLGPGNSTALQNMRYYMSDAGPCTIGLHALAIPGRIRDIPIIAQAKIDFPTPIWNKIWGFQNTAKMFQWELMIGARPSVWNASPLGLSTFSAGIEAGFKQVTLNADMFGSFGASNATSTPPQTASVHAVWQGFFAQLGLYY
ncbi:MAG: hypothetical protein ACP5U1_16190 [Desulfomonilaceae bacterium]